jgi:multidrug efflux pump subunit AcrA (membrane-fusion protein)
LLFAAALAAAICAVSRYHSGSAGSAKWRTEKVHHAKLQPTIVARGDVESAETSDVVCRVRSWARGSANATTIKWIIDNGAPVAKGQVVVVLDDSALQETLNDLKGPLELARAAWIFAEENLEIVRSQSQSDLQGAEVALRLAQIDLQKYKEGDYEQNRKDVQSRLSMAESDLEMWRDRAAWSESMVRKGYVNSGQARADQSHLESARVAVDKIQEEYRVLERYTKKRMLRELETRLAEARFDLRRLKCQARAKEAQADGHRLARRRIYENRLRHYQDIEEDIRKCILTAPNDGIVVYGTPDQAWSGAGSQNSVIASGEPVRTGQRLLSIPNLTKMQVTVGVHEAQVSRVRADTWKATGFGDAMQGTLFASLDPATRLVNQLAFAEMREQFREFEKVRVAMGQPAIVRLDAFPEHQLRGHVKQVAEVACQLDWLQRDEHMYPTQVAVDERYDGVKPDMSAEVTIFTADAEDVLAVPVEALVHEPDQGGRCSCFVLTADGPQERDVVVGMHTNNRAQVQAGLQEGEEVILEPRRAHSLLAP